MEGRTVGSNVKCYSEEQMEAILEVVDQVSQKVLNKVKVNSEIPSSFVREVQCYNQGKVLEFWYHLQNYASLVEYLDYLSDLGTDSEGVFEEIMETIDKMRKISEKLFEILLEVYIKNLDYIKIYFKLRNKLFLREENIYSPRTTIKVFVDENSGKIDYLLRDFIGPSKILSREFCVEENTAIKKVFENQGGSVMLNNIPDFKNIYGETFKNPRLDEFCVKKYKLTWKENIKITLNRLKKALYVDESWKNCWKDRDDAPINSFYKSTLVIPITLINNDIGNEFKEFLGIKRTNKKNVRAIYGFLCFDSIYPEFFDEIDKNYGYFWADIFSLYLVPLQMHGVDVSFFVYDQDV